MRRGRRPAVRRLAGGGSVAAAMTVSGRCRLTCTHMSMSGWEGVGKGVGTGQGGMVGEGAEPASSMPIRALLTYHEMTGGQRACPGRARGRYSCVCSLSDPSIHPSPDQAERSMGLFSFPRLEPRALSANFSRKESVLFSVFDARMASESREMATSREAGFPRKLRRETFLEIRGRGARCWRPGRAH